MGYRLDKEESAEDNLRRIALEQVEKALKEIEDKGLDRHEVVHQVRKRCKKLRGLIRLYRPGFGLFKEENTFLRDAARRLSSIRDAQSTIESLDALAGHYKDRADLPDFSGIRQELVSRRQEVAKDVAGLEKRLADFSEGMRSLRLRITAWSCTEEGFAAVAGGLGKTYRRGRKALGGAYENPTPNNFHEWRKRVKYHWYHARLLKGIWPEMLEVQGAAANTLGKMLGDDHDLAVLRETLEREAQHFGVGGQLQHIVDLIEKRRSELQNAAHPLGERLYAEKPQQLVARFGAYWSAWQTSL